MSVAVAAEVDWDALPDAQTPDLKPAPEREDATGDGPACTVCGEPIIREPGSRGRLPKIHPHCKTSGTTRASSTATRGSSRAKAEREADQIIAALQQQLTRAAVMLSVVDKFDAFVIMVSLPQLCANLRGVLISYDKIRKDMLAMSSGGSILGLVFTLVMMGAPIAAHHGFFGRGQIAKMLVEMPFTLLRISQQLKEGSEKLAQMMAEQMEAARRPPQKAEPDGAT